MSLFAFLGREEKPLFDLPTILFLKPAIPLPANENTVWGISLNICFTCADQNFTGPTFVGESKFTVTLPAQWWLTDNGTICNEKNIPVGFVPSFLDLFELNSDFEHALAKNEDAIFFERQNTLRGDLVVVSLETFPCEDDVPPDEMLDKYLFENTDTDFYEYAYTVVVEQLQKKMLATFAFCLPARNDEYVLQYLKPIVNSFAPYHS